MANAMIAKSQKKRLESQLRALQSEHARKVNTLDRVETKLSRIVATQRNASAKLLETATKLREIEQLIPDKKPSNDQRNTQMRIAELQTLTTTTAAYNNNPTADQMLNWLKS